MIYYNYKYTEIELIYPDFTTGQMNTLFIEIPGHKTQRNKKFIRNQMLAAGITATSYEIVNRTFKTRQYSMSKKDFMKIATPSLF